MRPVRIQFSVVQQVGISHVWIEKGRWASWSEHQWYRKGTSQISEWNLFMEDRIQKGQREGKVVHNRIYQYSLSYTLNGTLSEFLIKYTTDQWSRKGPDTQNIYRIVCFQKWRTSAGWPYMQNHLFCIIGNASDLLSERRNGYHRKFWTGEIRCGQSRKFICRSAV